MPAGSPKLRVATNRYVILDDPNTGTPDTASGFRNPGTTWGTNNWLNKNTRINATALYLDDYGKPVQGKNITFKLYRYGGVLVNTTTGITDSNGLANFGFDLNGSNYYGKWQVSASNDTMGANTTFIYNWWGCAVTTVCSGHGSQTLQTGAIANSPYLNGRDRATGSVSSHYATTTKCTFCHQSFDGLPGGSIAVNYSMNTSDVHRSVVGGCANSSCHGDYYVHGRSTTTGNALIPSCYNTSGGCHRSRPEISNKSTLNSSNIQTALSLYSINSTSFNATFHTPNSTIPCIICHGPMHNISKPDNSTRKNSETEPGQCTACHLNSSHSQNKAVNCTLCHSPDAHAPKFITNKTTASVANYSSTRSSAASCEDCHNSSGINSYFTGKGYVPKKNDSYAYNLTEHNNVVSCIVCHDRLHWIGYMNSTGRYQATRTGAIACLDCHSGTNTNVSDSVAYWGYMTPARSGHNNSVSCESCHAGSKHGIRFLQPDRVSFGSKLTPATCVNCHQQGYSGAPRIPAPMNHSNDPLAGQKWNNYWTSGTDGSAQYSACIYCHGATLHSLAALGKASLFDGNNRVNSTITNTTNWCTSCHWQGYTNGTSTYLDMVNAYLPLLVPPEITGNPTYGANKSKPDYYNHSQEAKDDQSCKDCHGGSSTTMTGFLHNVGVGVSGDDCLKCHVDQKSNYPAINTSAFGRHKNVNATGGQNSLTNDDCTTCHYDSSDMKNVRTLACANCHNQGNYSAKIIKNHRQNGVNITTPVNCYDCHNNSISFFAYDANSSSSHYTTNTSLTDTTYCTSCHKNSANGTKWGGASDPWNSPTFPHSLNNTPKEDCYACHNNISTSDFHNKTLAKPNISTVNCIDCHRTDRAMAPKKIDTSVFATGVHKNHACENCHVNATDSNMNGTYLFSADPAKSCTYCHTGTGRYNASLINEHNEAGQDVITAVQCTTCHDNNGMYLTNTGTNGTGTAITHYIKDVTDIGSLPYQHFGPINTTNCLNCHNGPNTSNPVWGSPVNISTSSKRQHVENTNTHCNDCHKDSNIASLALVDFHNASIKLNVNECIRCHTQDQRGYPRINLSLFTKHSNVNTTGDQNNLTNDDCTTCHYNFNYTEMNETGLTTLTKACDACHIDGNYSAPIISDHIPPKMAMTPGGKITTGAYCSTCHNNSINEYNFSVNSSSAHYGTNSSLLKPTVNTSSVPVNGFMNQSDAEAYNKPCNNCHNPANTSYGVITSTTNAHTSQGTCNECHVNTDADNLHNNSLGMPVNFSCMVCHTTYAEQYKAPNLTNTNHKNNFYDCTSTCHGTDYGTPGEFDAQDHNVDRKYTTYSNIPTTDVVSLNDIAAPATLSVPKGTIVRITSRIKDFYLDINTRASRVGGAEYYYGKTPVTDPGQGKGIPMTASDGMFDTVDGGWEAINGTLDTSGLSEGTYSIYVRGMDIGKQWSGVQSATLTVLPAMGYINGTVRDNNTKAGIPYAKVSTNTSETVNANSTGFYSFYVDAGSYMLTATSDPRYYANSSVTVNVMQDTETSQDIELVEKPKGTITGTVRNA